MKKLAISMVALSSIFLLTACGGNKETKDGTVASNGLQVKVVDGEYVQPYDMKTSSSKNGFLALQLKLKNTGDKSLTYSESDITLNSEDEDLEPEHAYDSTNKFKTIGYEKLSKGRSKTEYVVFEVDKSEKGYKLTIDPNTSEKADPIELKVNAKKYKDNTENIRDLVDSYVKQTFLPGAENADKKLSKDFTLANKIEEDQKKYMDEFKKDIKDSCRYYQPSDADLEKIAKGYVDANSKRAKMEYTVKSYLPTSATITVKPSVINFDDMDLEGLANDYVEKHGNSSADYETKYKEAEKYILENLGSRYDSAAINTPKYMSGDGYDINISKDVDSGKWTVDSSDADLNYSYKDLVKAFTGGIKY
ncbi:DUF4352 domain-containing protein [Streptococcus parauberis]|uniref:DUF4352 domain-containing protein n=1 Tax=Streptococcus parauberis TaxID=1348 RepID=UPI00289222F9|nr:DUF4352 domain-containing protein [Streptococcus parauberis]MDT2749016.1 DUF4352 domain-containing protein [Streptococcus parauberis]